MTAQRKPDPWEHVEMRRADAANEPRYAEPDDDPHAKGWTALIAAICGLAAVVAVLGIGAFLGAQFLTARFGLAPHVVLSALLCLFAFGGLTYLVLRVCNAAARRHAEWLAQRRHEADAFDSTFFDTLT